LNIKAVGLLTLLIIVTALVCLNVGQLQAAEPKYTKVDPTELSIIFEAEITRLTIGADSLKKVF
jgi:hypothetical protein